MAVQESCRLPSKGTLAPETENSGTAKERFVRWMRRVIAEPEREGVRLGQERRDRSVSKHLGVK
jgi:hypothetical protein